MEHFNRLTPAESERLDLLTEELGEVIQIIGKIKRHGYENYHPDDPSTTNRQLLEKEMGHIEAAMDIMAAQGDIMRAAVVAHCGSKLRRVGKWLHHNAVPVTP